MSSEKTDLLLFLKENYDKLPDQMVYMSLLLAEFSSNLTIGGCIYDMESFVGPTWTCGRPNEFWWYPTLRD